MARLRPSPSAMTRPQTPRRPGTRFTGRDQVNHGPFGKMIEIPGIVDGDFAVTGTGTGAGQPDRSAPRADPGFGRIGRGEFHRQLGGVGREQAPHLPDHP